MGKSARIVWRRQQITKRIKAQKKKLNSAIKRKHEAGFVIANEARKLKKLIEERKKRKK